MPGPATSGAPVAQPDVTPLQVALPELGLLGGQRVQGPARGDQPGVGGDPGLGLAEGPVEFGQVIERLGLALDQRLGPGGRVGLPSPVSRAQAPSSLPRASGPRGRCSTLVLRP